MTKTSKIKEIKTVAYEDLGPEAIFEIKIKDFPLFVAHDLNGNDIFALARLTEWQRKNTAQGMEAI
ncbi:MAG: fumarate hydratase C-terminal domain-containing protein [Actinomycetota bacterium]|nr:fumarate hydratase C-terminal domain-containing protein [Actinomycetota bacterium]